MLRGTYGVSLPEICFTVSEVTSIGHLATPRVREVAALLGLIFRIISSIILLLIVRPLYKGLLLLLGGPFLGLSSYLTKKELICIFVVSGFSLTL